MGLEESGAVREAVGHGLADLVAVPGLPAVLANRIPRGARRFSRPSPQKETQVKSGETTRKEGRTCSAAGLFLKVHGVAALQGQIEWVSKGDP